MDSAPLTAEAGEWLQQAVGLLRNKQPAEAEKLLDKVLALAPDQGDALHFKGVLRHQQGRSDEGIELIRQAARAMPGHAGIWTNLGNILMERERVDEAVQAWEHGIAVSEGDVNAASPLCNLSVVYRKQGRLPEAEAACRRALELLPELAEGWYNLSVVLMERGEVAEGIVANSRAVALWPQALQAREQVIRALMLLGERERAAQMFRDWLAEDPDNPVVQHQLAACGADAAPARASDAYVEQVFDSFAASFDVKLGALNYRAPGLVAQALEAAAGAAQGTLEILDAGCGTGLCGPLIRPWARRLAGCDLSVGMLRRADARHVYDVLHKAELVEYMDAQPGSYDAIVSADTLCYFGDLGAVMAAACKCLRPGGWLVFTVEALADDAGEPHRLQLSGRYAHAKAHVQTTLAAAGLHAIAIAPVVLRSEAARPVQGWLVTAGKP